jgi:hypothetical protein
MLIEEKSIKKKNTKIAILSEEGRAVYIEEKEI